MNLRTALRLDRPARVAFVGAGGKTTAMFRLARELPPPVIVTTTTHLGAWQIALGDRWIAGLEGLGEIEAAMPAVTVVTGPPAGDERMRGLDLEEAARLAEIASEKGWSLLVEADGSRQRPLKAPGEHEPIIPAWAETVVVVAGLSGLGKPCNNAYIHRSEHFAELAGLSLEDAVGEESLRSVLLHPLGGMKGIPAGARKVVLLNQADDAHVVAQAARLAESLLAGFDATLVGCLKNPPGQEILLAREPIAGIVLAAGGSTRFGVAKQALAWRGRSFLENVLQVADDAHLRPVIAIINNAYSHNINNKIISKIQFLNNPNWQAGQSTSIRLGVQSLPANVGGAVFLLCDQPHIPAQLVRDLVDRHASTLAPIIAPLAGGRRANPVLFDRATFVDLLGLEGDRGGRALFSNHPVEYVPWNDEAILLDVDTPEDYARLLELE